MSSEDKRVFEIGKRTCPNFNHGPYVVDESLDTVECKACGAKLNPMWVLKKMAQTESSDIWQLQKLKAAKKEAMEKTKTKCEHCKKITRIKMRTV